MKLNFKLTTLLTTLYCFTHTVTAATLQDPCTFLLNVIDRPSIGDAACAVPKNKMIIEAGYQYQKNYGTPAYQHIFPQAVYRLGLPQYNEFVLILPSYNHQNQAPSSGFTASVIGLKHELSYDDRWVTSVESLITLPTGSKAFGSQSAGIAFNGIASYNLSSKINVTMMMGVTTQTQPRYYGGDRFTSINPNIVFSYAFRPNINFYAEFYGQSKTAPNQSTGYNFDGGVVYLLKDTITLDLEIGKRLTGQLNGLDRYLGTGFTLML